MPQMRTRRDRPQVFCAGCAARAVSPAAIHSAQQLCALLCVQCAALAEPGNGVAPCGGGGAPPEGLTTSYRLPLIPTAQIR